MPEQNPHASLRVDTGTNLLLTAARLILIWALVAAALAFVLAYVGGYHPSPAAYALPVLPATVLCVWFMRMARRARPRGRGAAPPWLRAPPWLVGPVLLGLCYLLLLYPVLGVLADSLGTPRWRSGVVEHWERGHHFGRRSQSVCTHVRARFIDGSGRPITMSQCLADDSATAIPRGTVLWVASRESPLGVVTPGVVELGDRAPRSSGAR